MRADWGPKGWLPVDFVHSGYATMNPLGAKVDGVAHIKSGVGRYVGSLDVERSRCACNLVHADAGYPRFRPCSAMPFLARCIKLRWLRMEMVLPVIRPNMNKM
jgi:hypothetical protein